MAAPNVNVKEVDLSTRVPSFPGLYGGILIPGAKKGPVGVPVLVTSEAQLLKEFTPNERVEVGYDLSYYSAQAFLQKSNKLWVVRVANQATYGGILVNKSNDLAPSTEISEITNPANFDFGENDSALLLYGANPGVWNNKIKVKIVNYKHSEVVTINATSFEVQTTQSWPTGFPVVLSTTGVMPAGLTAGINYFVVQADGNIELATTETNAKNGVVVSVTTVGSGVLTLRPSKEFTKEVDTFLLQVYKEEPDLTISLKEEFVCSLEVGRKDGFGRNIYVETVLQSSNYIRAMVEPSIELNSTGTSVHESYLDYISLDNGSDGTLVTDSNMLLALDTLKNTEDKQLTVIMDGGWTTPAYQKQGLLALAESRKDCVAILSTPFEAEDSSNYLNEIVNYRKTVLNANSSFGAIYSPHPQIFDKFNDRFIYVSPDGFASAAISETAANYEMWYPVGGFKRGLLNVLDVRRRFTTGEMDYLYDNGINPIRFAPGRGIVIWGQKTLLNRPSSLDRLNVRLLLIVVEPAVKAALEDFIFDINTDGARAIVRAKISDYMDGIQARNGVYEYYVVCDKTNNSPDDIDNHIMNVHLYVKPTQSVEYIPFTVVITSTGLDFSIAQQSV